MADMDPAAGDAPPHTSPLSLQHLRFPTRSLPNATAASTSSTLLASNSESSRQRPLLNAATKVGESHSIKGDTGTSASRRRVRSEDVQEKREGSSSAKDGTDASVLERCYHPCHYVGLAKQAFLKCLGLDPSSTDSANTRQRKEE